MKNMKRGFTLSEVVITLIVIGVVAAITIPMLSNDVNDKKWNVARQKARATIGEAFKLMTINGEITTNKTTAQFVNEVIPKYLKIAKTCTITNAYECGMSTAENFYKRPDGTNITLKTSWSTSTNAYGVTGSYNSEKAGYTSLSTNNFTTANFNNSYFFQTLDGFSVNFFYNPYCAVDSIDKNKIVGSFRFQHSLDVTCFMGVYDMNGKKGPNKIGMDVGFVGSVYNGYEVRATAVLPHKTELQVKSIKTGNYPLIAIEYCNKLGKDNDWILPDIDELVMLYLNRYLVNLGSHSFWSRSISMKNDQNNTRYRRVYADTTGDYVYGLLGSNTYVEATGGYLRCVRNTSLK